MHNTKTDTIHTGVIFDGNDGYNEFENNLIKENEDIAFKTVNKDTDLDITNVKDKFIKEFDINNDNIINRIDMILYKNNK